MIDTIKKEDCTGCYACVNVCPQNCIIMKGDANGFKYPEVDYDRCSRCGLCLETCPSLTKPTVERNWKVPKVFAGWSKNDEIRFKSTSGGIFTELALKVVNQNGLVVGARYTADHFVEHEIVSNEEGIERLRQSKYVQSDIGFAFRELKTQLDGEKLIAFCGSPCQVAGLLNYLKTDYDNLITFDFVCRGTNSPKAYRKYLEMLESKYKSKVRRIWFKNKSHGWNRFSTRVDFCNGKTYLRDRYADLYMRGYIEFNLYIRPSCSVCKYKSFPRVADITLGDFWGVGNGRSVLDPDKGTSLVMINTEKGLRLFDSIQGSIFREASSIDLALPGNACIEKSIVPNPKSEMFLSMLDDHPFDQAFRKCIKTSWVRNMKRWFHLTKIRIKHKIRRSLPV